MTMRRAGRRRPAAAGSPRSAHAAEAWDSSPFRSCRVTVALPARRDDGAHELELPRPSLFEISLAWPYPRGSNLPPCCCACLLLSGRTLISWVAAVPPSCARAQDGSCPVPVRSSQSCCCAIGPLLTLNLARHGSPCTI